MLKYWTRLLACLFLFSRIIFINQKDVFFDSAEYLHLFANANFFHTVAYGHAPPHEGYLLLFWPIFQLARLLHYDPAYVVILGQIVLSFLAIYCFYKFVLFLSDQKTALLSALLISLTPLFWITNVTIMMETAYVSFFFFALYFLIGYLQKNKISYLHYSLFFLSLGLVTHTMVILWIPLYLGVIFFKRQKKLRIVAFHMLFYLLAFTLLNIFFLSNMLKMDVNHVVHYLYLNKGGEFARTSLSLNGFLIVMRNFLIPLLRNNTSLIVFLGFISLLFSFVKKREFFILGVLWIAPALYANQWWDSLLNGRHAILAGFGLAFLVAYLVRKKLMVTFFVVAYLLIVSLPALQLLQKEIPYRKEAEYVKSLPKDSLLIESHFARPQVQETYVGKVYFVNEPGSSKEDLQKNINTYLTKNKPVFISSSALSEPYGLYSGPYVHNITLSYTKSFEMASIITKYTLVTYKIMSREDNLIMYKIVSTKPSPYPNIMSLQNSYRRLDYYDPLWRISRLVTNDKTHTVF